MCNEIKKQQALENVKGKNKSSDDEAQWVRFWGANFKISIKFTLKFT